MAWVEAATLSVKGAKLAYDVSRTQPTVERYVNRILHYIRHGNAVVPIFGAGGVGKSTLSQAMCSPTPERIDPKTYNESIGIEEVLLTGNVPGKVLVAPGQHHRIDSNWPELYDSFSCGAGNGVINVVSFGLHSFSPLSYKEIDIYEEGMDLEAFRVAYTAQRRDVEIVRLKQLAAALALVRKPIWMATIVNKQDIWLAEGDKVRDFYENSEYGATINKISDQLGRNRFQHEFVPAAMTLENFVSRSGELIAKTTSGFDLGQIHASRSLAIRQLASLIARGRRRNG